MITAAITMDDILAKRAELIGPGGFFELEDKDVDGHPYKIYKHAPATSIAVSYTHLTLPTKRIV